MRPIATTGSEARPVYPDLPTVDEAGLKGFEVDLWLWHLRAGGRAGRSCAKLNASSLRRWRMPELIDGVRQDRRRAGGTTPQEGAAFLKSEFDKWKKVIADGNIKAAIAAGSLHGSCRFAARAP